MITELQLLNDTIFKQVGEITAIVKDHECEEYLGYNFRLNNCNIKFRKSKITPKKVGQFVTLWKRNEEKQTEPFSINDHFDFYIIASFDNENLGYFIFPKSILAKQKILTSNTIEGKRGFRVYPNWVKAENKQANKTQEWQIEYFINLEETDTKIIQQINTMFNKNNLK